MYTGSKATDDHAKDQSDKFAPAEYAAAKHEAVSSSLSYSYSLSFFPLFASPLDRLAHGFPPTPARLPLRTRVHKSPPVGSLLSLTLRRRRRR